MSDDTTQMIDPAVEQVAPAPQAPSLQLTDLVLALQTIQAAAQRGAVTSWRAASSPTDASRRRGGPPWPRRGGCARRTCRRRPARRPCGSPTGRSSAPGCRA